MTPAKALGCGIGFAGVLIATLGNHGGGSARGVAYMLIATVLFTLAGPWNKSVTRRADSFAVCFVSLFVGGAALFLLGAVLGGRLEHWSVLSVLDLAGAGLHLRRGLHRLGPADEEQSRQPDRHLPGS